MSRCARRIALVVAVLLLGPEIAHAAAEEGLAGHSRNRLAIVIGNTEYASARIPDLANAKNDAIKLSDSLRRLNFEVLTGIDLSADGFERLLREADARLPSVSSVLVFYSGHGLQMQGKNYLLAADTPDPDSVEKVTSRAVRLDDVIARFSSRDRQTFIFLDACRNNPLGAAADLADGLAQVEVGENVYIAFATQPGNIAVDGAGDNSPFSTALLDNVEIPGLSIADMMIRVRNQTEALTAGQQVPWDQSNLREQFYFTEQQELDPVQLSASLSRILSDPTAKEKLQVELASNDLQTAVIIVGQTLRSVDVDGQPAAAPQADVLARPPTTQLASLAPPEGARQSAASGIEALITSLEGQEAERAELARSVQTELRRLGCYRMTVDGEWGKGSVRALADYYKNTGQAAQATEPTVALLSDLFLRSGRICKQPVIVKKAKASTVAQDTGSRPAASGGKKAGKRSGSAASRPAPPPPDISGGIGIGGVF